MWFSSCWDDQFFEKVFWKSNSTQHNEDTSKLVTDHLKRTWSAPLSPKEPSSLSTVEISSSSQRTESDVQTSRTIHTNEEKSTNENNKRILVQCQPGSDYAKGLIFGRKLLKHLLITNNLKHIKLQLHMNS